jgi:predicted nucleic acid-binding protein
MRIALDTNILVYAAGVDRGPDDAPKIEIARRAMRKLAETATLIAPTQALGELFVVLQRAGYARAEARAIALEFAQSLGEADSARATMAAAFDLTVDHTLELWDALILSAAVEAGCSLLLSEDIPDGFVFRGLTVANPFASPHHRKLAPLLAEP